MEDSSIEIAGYEVKRTLGKGGMATVYLAIQESFEREVAIKVMSHELSADPSFGERFLREAKIVSRLVHPNIVTVYDVGVSNGHHFLSMEYVSGVDLKEQLGSISFFHLIKVIKDIALALNYAGNQGYVHRDIKPENIMVNEHDGRSILMDFGIAKAFDSVSGMTQTGTAIGTPYYMSPEQAKGKEVDFRSDIYSLGVVFFQLLTGRVPYNGDSAVSVGIKHISDPIPCLPEYLSEPFQAIISKLLAKHRKDRYQNGLELIDDINKIPESSLNYVAEKFDSEGSRKHIPGIDFHVETPLAHSISRLSKAIPVVEDTDATQVMNASIRTPKIPETKIEQLLATLKDKFNNQSAIIFLKNKPYGLPIATGITLVVFSSLLYLAVSQEDTPPQLKNLNNELTTIETTKQVTKEPIDIIKEKTESTESDELLNVLLVEAKILEGKFEKDVTVVNQLHLIYQQISAIEQNHPDVENGYKKIKETYLDLITTYLHEEQYQEANVASAKLLELFPELANSDTIMALNQQIEHQLKVVDLLNVAEQYILTNKLSGNDEQNANYYYQKTLILSPNNKKATAGLYIITEQYYKFAEDMLKQKRPNQALSYLERGLSIQHVQNDNLNKLKNQIITQQTQQNLQKKKDGQLKKQIEKLLSQARGFLRKNALISPENNNALSTYNKVIKLDKNNRRAREGLKDIEVKLVAEITQHINASDFDLAGTKVNEATFALPKNKAIKGVQRLLISKRAEFIANAKPKILLLSVKGSNFTSIKQSNNGNVKTDRTVYIGFTYNNFETETSLLHAELYDGSKTVKIRTVPVIISGKKGEKFFKISRPVTGFPEGGYYVDISLNKSTLISSQFTIVK